MDEKILDDLLDIFFLFQAEDGIRDATVTGVQTCALPIWARPGDNPALGRAAAGPGRESRLVGMIHIKAEDRMNKIFRVLGVLAAVAALLVGAAGLAVAQGANAPTPPSSGEPAYEVAEPGESETGQQPQASSQTELPV